MTDLVTTLERVAVARVAVSSHAVVRGKQRDPELRQLEERDVRAKIHTEVALALDAGRQACSPPRWLMGDKRRKRTHTGRGRIRYVWPPGEVRAYVIREDRADNVWIVMTTLTPFERRAA